MKNILLTLFIPALLFAADSLHSFNSGDTVSAQKFNDNFRYLEELITDLVADRTADSTKIAILEANRETDSSDIANLKSSVQSYEARIAELEGRTYEIKYLQDNLYTNQSNVGDLAFNNLEVGKSYRINLNVYWIYVGISGATIRGRNGTDYVVSSYFDPSNASEATGALFSTASVFTATSNTLTFETVGFTGTDNDELIAGSGTISHTYVILEELSSKPAQ